MSDVFKENEIVIGKIKGNGNRYAFLVTNKGDVFVPPKEYRLVFNGDTVEGEIFFENEKPQVKIKKVKENSLRSYIGICKVTENGFFVIPEKNDESKINHWLRIPKSKRKKASDGDYVRVEIIEYPFQNRRPKGMIRKVIGKNDSPNFEANYCFEKKKLPVYFSNEVTDKSYEFDQSFITKEKNKGRKDLTMLPFITIDGENTRDIDDAILCKKTNDGWKLWVAISDVSSFVKENDIIDKEAMNRTSSVYTPLRYVAMLPENLSSNLCSLNPNVERLALVCFMQFSHNGSIENYSFYEGVIRSKARMNYDEVESFLSNSLDVDYENSVINNLKNICDFHEVLRTYRKDNFIITPREENIRYVFDDKRQPINVESTEYKKSYRVVEEMMLMANMTAADFLSKNFEKGIYRKNDCINDEKVFSSYLNDIGIETKGDLNEMSNYKDAFLKIIKNKKASNAMQYFMDGSEYSIFPKKHLGLGIEKYTYFTSPIRRYSDIVIHRMIKSIISNKKVKPIDENLIYLLNKKEKEIRDVSLIISKMINCKLIKNVDISKEKAKIVSINKVGLKVNIEKYNIQGFIYSNSISNDIQFDSNTKKLFSNSKNVSFQLGDEIEIKLNKVLQDKNEIILELN